MLEAIGKRQRVINSSFAKRSGETSRTSIWPAWRAPLHLQPILGVRRIDGLGPYPDTPGGFDLVAHQSKQGRNQKRTTRALVPQQLGRDEVHDTLTPAGALYYQQSLTPADQCLNGLPLTRMELGVGRSDGLA
jgi:hypothetical protein